MPGVAVKSSEQRLGAFAGGHQAASALVGERHHAVDVLELVEREAAEGIRDQVGRRRRAVDRGQDADVVARARRAVRPRIPAEGRHRALRDGERRPAGAELMRSLGLIHAEVVAVHVITRRDVARRSADRLAVLVHLAARGHRKERELVASRKIGTQRDGATPLAELDDRARLERAQRDRHLVVGIKMQGDPAQRLCRRHVARRLNSGI